MERIKAGILSGVVFCAICAGSISGAEEADALLLLNVKSDGMLSVRDLVFTKVDSGEEVRIRDLLSLGRADSPKFILEPLSAGEYYLSSIYPTVNMNDAARRIEADEDDGIITILSGTINYIGEFTLTSRERGSSIVSSFSYEPNPETLIAALSAERALFESMDVGVSIAGNAPVAVDKELLGL